MEQKVLDFFRKKAEQIIEREYHDEIQKIKRSIMKRQSKMSDDETQRLKKEWKNENNILILEFKAKFENNLKRYNNDFNKSIQLFDKQTESGSNHRNEKELIKNLNINNFEKKIYYELACKDAIRNAKSQERKWRQQRRKDKREIILRNNREEQKIRENLQSESSSEYDRVFMKIETKRQDILKERIDIIDKKWTVKQKTEMELFNEEWARTREKKINNIIEDTIKRDKERIIGYTGQLSTEVFDIHNVFNERVNNEWDVERSKLINSKKLYISSIIKEITFKINKKYEIIIENKTKEIDKMFETEINTVNTLHEKRIEQMIIDYKKTIINNLEKGKKNIDKYKNRDDYDKFKKDCERSHNSFIRNEKKKLRNIKITSSHLLPENAQNQIKILVNQKKNILIDINNKTTKRHFDMKELYNKCRIEEIVKETTKIEEKENAKVILEVDSLEQAWKSNKKENSLLLNKVKYNAHLETKLLESNQINKQKDEENIYFKMEIQKKENEIIQLKNEITKKDALLKKFEIEMNFLKKFKEKYLEVQDNKKKKKKEKTRGVWGRHNIIEEPKTKNDFQEIEKKLLMKSVLREKGPIFEHIYKCNGIYRDEGNIQIIFKANDKDIISIKYEHEFRTVSFISFGSKISLPFAFDINKFFCITIKIVNSRISVEINNTSMGTYDLLDDTLLTKIIIRVSSNKSLFYHQYIRPLK